MPAIEFKIDFSEYEKAVNRLYQMHEIRRRDIAAVFRNADKSLVRAAKQAAGKSKKGMISKKYPSRSHTAGHLRREIKFKTSKKYKFVYYVNSGAFYSMAYIKGHKGWAGNPFMERAIRQTEAQVSNDIKNGLMKLTQKEWQNG